VSDIPGGWFHCSRCGALFRAAADADKRGHCPECGGDPVTGDDTEEAPEPVRIRRKVRKPKERTDRSKRHRNSHGKRKARALAVFVIIWCVVLGATAVWVKKRLPDATAASSAEDAETHGGQAMEDSRLLQDQLEGCEKRLQQFLLAKNIAGQSPHVLRADKILAEMARSLQFNPIFAAEGTMTTFFYQVIHTPAGRAIEMEAKLDEGKQVEAVFFEEGGEWKIDWHAITRASSGSWPLFVSGKGKDEGEFRLLARERIGASGRDPEFIGLVLYAPRPGHPGEAVSPSPEIRVPRGSEMGRAIEEAFASRAKDLGPFGSGVVKFDPDDMIRLHVRVTREGEEERVFRISELLATHWMEQPLVR
jgi:hypothetical protein